MVGEGCELPVKPVKGSTRLTSDGSGKGSGTEEEDEDEDEDEAAGTAAAAGPVGPGSVAGGLRRLLPPSAWLGSGRLSPPWVLAPPPSVASMPASAVAACAAHAGRTNKTNGARVRW